MENYRKVTILNLCKILEPRKDDQHKYTLRYFINFWKEEPNYSALQERMANSTVDMTDRGTGKTAKRAIGAEMLEFFNTIDFEADLAQIKHMHKQLKTYRNKRLCHNDKSYATEIVPPIAELNGFIDEIEAIMHKYYHLFRQAINYDDLKRPHRYRDFTLLLD